MAHDNSEHLRFDSRLAARRGWISATERKTVLDALPDLADNAELLADEEQEPGEETRDAAVQPSDPDPTPQAPSEGF